MRIDPLFYDGGSLRTPAPSSDEQNAPFGPTAHAWLDQAPEHPGWSIVDGGMCLDAEGSTWVTDVDAARTLIVADPKLSSYRAEFALAGRVTHVGARYGVLVAFTDAENYAEVILDEGSRQLSLRRFRNNIGQVLARTRLGSVDLTAIHTLRVDRTVSTLEVRLNDQVMLAAEIGGDPGQVGVVSYRTAVQPAFAAVTDHESLFGDHLVHVGERYRAGAPIVVGGNGVGTALARSTELVNDEGAAENVYVHEFERFGERAVVRFRPVEVSDETFVEIVSDSTSTIIRSVIAGAVTAESRHEAAAPRFSVRTVAAGHTLLVSVCGVTERVSVAHAERFTQRINLSGATLRSLDRTALPAQTRHQ